jgi:hypothetical protein
MPHVQRELSSPDPRKPRLKSGRYCERSAGTVATSLLLPRLVPQGENDMPHPSDKPDLNPATQDDQPNKGPIKQPQQTDATMREKDLPRGSEPETRGNSGRRQ